MDGTARFILLDGVPEGCRIRRKALETPCAVGKLRFNVWRSGATRFCRAAAALAVTMPRLPKTTKKPDAEALRARLAALRACSDGRLDAQGRSQQEQIAALEDEIAGRVPVVEAVKDYVVSVA